MINVCLLQPWFFGPTWTLLYTCMGVASYFVWRAGIPFSATAFKLYAAQLIFNLAWQVGSARRLVVLLLDSCAFLRS